MWCEWGAESFLRPFLCAPIDVGIRFGMVAGGAKGCCGVLFGVLMCAVEFVASRAVLKVL